MTCRAIPSRTTTKGTDLPAIYGGGHADWVGMNYTPFTKPIFYGNSNRLGNGPTDLAIRELDWQVKLMHSLNSGLQQPAHPENKAHAKLLARQDARLRKDRRALARSIKIALNI